MQTLRPLARALLVAALLSTGACNKLERKFGNPPGESLPDAPFSIDCRLKSGFIANDSVSAGDDPAWLRLQVNPKGEFFKVVERRGALPDYDTRYYRTDEYRKGERGKAYDGTIFEIASGIPFVIGTANDETQPFRFHDYARGVLILREANDAWFRDGPLNSKGAAIPYMRLDIKERTLSIRYEWRRGVDDYAEYRKHGNDGPASFDFKCARSPRDTVIEVDGFDQ